MDFDGEYQFRLDGEKHLWNPETITRLQQAVVSNDPKEYAAFAEEVNEQTRQLCTLRGLFEFVPGEPVPLDEVDAGRAKSASGSTPGRCRTARSARKPTKRWPSR